MATGKRTIEIFSAGCPVCDKVIAEVRRAACASCDVQVLDMTIPDVRDRANDLGVRSIPAVAIDGKLADCCSGRSVDVVALQSAGLGQAIV